jgi:hypothetical protein
MAFVNPQMKIARLGFRSIRCYLLCALLLLAAREGFTQVSPAEIKNPDLKAAEAKYFPQLKALNREISATQFPFSLYLSRFVGLDPAKQAEADSRGLEFVRFHDRAVLKITANYNAAYNADLLNQNERASRTFQEVIVPILKLVTKEIPPDVTCDAIGFEISYHARTPNRNYDYEGKEILVVLFERADAFAFLPASAAERQEILNRSDVYVNGREFGLALGEHDAIDVEALPRSVPRKVPEASPASAAASASQLAVTNPNLAAPRSTSKPAPPGTAAASMADTPAPDSGSVPEFRAVPPTQSDLDGLQAKYKTQLETLAKEGSAKFHFVDYAPPSFAIFQNKLVLQLTLRNSLHFDAEKSSIYKRAAQSFDLFLAPQFKDLLDKTPTDAEFDAYDFSILNQLSATPHPLSEAIEFICPRKAATRFANAEITNQQLVDQSIVLVNGVRVALNLQLVE